MGNTFSQSKAVIPPPIVRQDRDTTMLCWSFLNARETERLSRSCKKINSQLRVTLIEKKKVSLLLTHIFNADPFKVGEFLDKFSKQFKTSNKTVAEQCLVLTKSSCREEYFSPSKNRNMVKRIWTNISPLEAAAWCGDIFLVRELLRHVPFIQKQEVVNQLKGILERNESEENGVFLFPFKELIKAHHIYYFDYPNLYHNPYGHSELQKLWKEVWEKQRLLPTYGLQEYCDDKPFLPTPSFTLPPKRSCTVLCKLNYKSYEELPLDLDNVNAGIWQEFVGDFWYALYKGSKTARLLMPTAAGFKKELGDEFAGRAGCDLLAISQLCDVRTADLCNLIKDLEGPKHLEESDFEERKEALDRP